MEPELLRSVKILVKTAIAVLALILIYLLFEYTLPLAWRFLGTLPSYIMPFIVAVIVAILIEPLIIFFQTKIKMGRGLATFVSLILSIGTVGFLIVALASRLISELVKLYKVLAGQSSDMSQFIMATINKAQLFYLRLNLPKDVEKSVQTNLYDALGGLQDVIGYVVNLLVQFVAGLPNLFILLMIAFIATYFVAKERLLLKEMFMSVLPESWEGKTQTVMSDLLSAFVGFIKAETILVSITGIQTIIGLKLLGSEYALTLGILCGIMDILPYLGPGTIFIPWIIGEFVLGNLWMGIGLSILYATISAVRAVLEPRIVGEKVGLHPLATLVALYVGLKVAGFVGMIIGIALIIFYMSCKRAGVFANWSWKRTIE
ncbi:MAG: sporulation integral membrane protein YtvI [Ignavibacteriales bacterium]